MSRALTIGNGNLLVGIDQYAQVRDFYFPYVGHANHVSGASGSYNHRVGVWIDGVLRWTTHDSWELHLIKEIEDESLSTCATNVELGVQLVITDVVHNEHNIFLRKIVVTNMHHEERLIKIFFGQEFRISESRRGDTGFYDPRVQSIIHYKGHNTFLIHAVAEGVSFTEYTVGLFGIEGKEGSYTDAEDGILAKNPIEHGSVDSVIGISCSCRGADSVPLYYWITAGKDIKESHALHALVREETAERLISSILHYRNAWVNKESKDFSFVEDKLKTLYQQSLQIIRVHTDNRGGIIASSDSDMLNQGRDAYSYVWPRDATITANALDRAGYYDVTERYFKFIAQLVESDGYVMHKYRVDGALGSSWHPWVRNGHVELPIQEDETALPVYLLAQHYERAKDLEFIESLYNPFVEPAADFMCRYRDDETGLPSDSYDLWEEKFGSSTYTASAVYGALQGAAQLSALLGKRVQAEKYRNCADQIKQAILTHLFDVSKGSFIKLVRHDDNKLAYDKTIDISSLHGILYFGVLDSFDARVVSTCKVMESTLKVPTSFGGYMRYEGDNYYRTGKDATPNAWCITTLWMAQCYIRSARTKEDLKEAYGILLWILDRATVSGILPEQINPYTGAHLSTSPLVWSQSEFVITVDEYLKKMKTFR